jgi:hypothetical protein
MKVNMVVLMSVVVVIIMITIMTKSELFKISRHDNFMDQSGIDESFNSSVKCDSVVLSYGVFDLSNSDRVFVVAENIKYLLSKSRLSYPFFIKHTLCFATLLQKSIIIASLLQIYG